MKVKIQKLIAYTQQNKKFKTPAVTIANKQYLVSPNPLDQRNYSGSLIQLLFTCNFPDNAIDYDYLKYELKVQNIQLKEIIKREGDTFKDIKKNEGKRQFIIDFVLPYQGAYNLLLDLNYRQKMFVQSSVAVEEKKQNLKIAMSCELPFDVEENIIYEEKPSSISFPLFVQYIIINKIKQHELQLSYQFATEFFDFHFLNNQKTIALRPGETYYLMLQIRQKQQKEKRNILFGDKGHLIGTLWLTHGKSKLQKKLFLKQGYKHLLFKGESIDKKVVKKDIVEVRIKFINTYEMDYNIGNIRISIEEKQLPAGIKLLKISKDKIDLTKNNEEIITLTLICMRSGLFQLKGIVLNIKDKVNPLEQRILKYVNQLTLVVQNEKQKKGDIVMERTIEVEIDSLI